MNHTLGASNDGDSYYNKRNTYCTFTTLGKCARDSAEVVEISAVAAAVNTPSDCFASAFIATIEPEENARCSSKEYP